MFKPGLILHFEGEKDPANGGGTDCEIRMELKGKNDSGLAFAKGMGGIVDADASGATKSDDQEISVVLGVSWRGTVIELIGSPTCETKNVVGEDGGRNDASAKIGSGVDDAAGQSFNLFRKVRDAWHG